MEKINIVLVDDHKIIMEGISSLLLNEEAIDVVGQAINRDELFELLDNQVVHVVIMDIFLPEPVGIEILKEIQKKHSKVRVILLSGNDEEVLVAKAFEAGATGYITKSVEREELVEAIQVVYEGGQYVEKALEEILSCNFIIKTRSGDRHANSKIAGLTPRENEIIRALCEGLSYKEVASQLVISTRAVEAQKNIILEKLELNNTIELVRFAIKNKITLI